MTVDDVLADEPTSARVEHLLVRRPVDRVGEAVVVALDPLGRDEFVGVVPGEVEQRRAYPYW